MRQWLLRHVHYVTSITLPLLRHPCYSAPVGCETAQPVGTTRCSFRADAAGARGARKFARKVLASYGDQAAVAELIVAELAANVVRHANTPFQVEVQAGGRLIRVAVRDGAAVDLRATAAAGDATSGRGLAIVESLAYRWGVDRTDAGKTVWAELLCPEIDGRSTGRATNPANP